MFNVVCFVHLIESKTPPPKKERKRKKIKFLLNLKPENICELMQKIASPYLSPFQNGRCLKLTRVTILLYKTVNFWVKTGHVFDYDNPFRDVWVASMVYFGRFY